MIQWGAYLLESHDLLVPDTTIVERLSQLGIGGNLPCNGRADGCRHGIQGRGLHLVLRLSKPIDEGIDLYEQQKLSTGKTGTQSIDKKKSIKSRHSSGEGALPIFIPASSSYPEPAHSIRPRCQGSLPRLPERKSKRKREEKQGSARCGVRNQGRMEGKEKKKRETNHYSGRLCVIRGRHRIITRFEALVGRQGSPAFVIHHDIRWIREVFAVSPTVLLPLKTRLLYGLPCVLERLLRNM